ncbi:hypothetical protein [Gimibacter soli]|uniref:Uncharacterized protein n=1 Tax=Gimibacter soli TaxID=3024400 RepID=A0AAE9XUX4_9PROT|nr:hypothetical protein [Gimibacter soli]WCL55611.1 hypothetical protein PH603_07530 [Gimibacter soli]
MSQHKNSSIYSLALVADAMANSGDYISGFVELLSDYANDHAEKYFEAASVRSYFDAELGIEISEEIATFLISRLVKAGMLSTTRIGGGGTVSYKWVGRAKNTSLDAIQGELEGEISRLLKAFMSFVERNFAEFSMPDEDRALEGLTKVLASIGSQVEVGEANSGSLEEDSDPESQRLTYLAGRFIADLADANLELFEFSIKLTGAAMLAEALADMRNPGARHSSLAGRTFILDAPVVIDALGLAGHLEKENSKFVLDRLRALKATVGVLEHSVDEIAEILKMVLSAQSFERRGSIGNALRTGQVREPELRAVQMDPEAAIKDLGISIFKTENVTPNSVKYFDESHENELMNDLLGGGGWSNPVAAERDSRSVAYVMRRRMGKRVVDALEATYLFITNNVTLRNRTHRFCTSSGLFSDRHAGPIIMRRRMATLLWLNDGNATIKELSRRQILLNCDRVVRASPALIQKMQYWLKNLNGGKADHFAALLLKPRSAQVMSDLTLNDASIVTSGNAEELLAAMEAELEKKYEESAADKMLQQSLVHGAIVSDLVKGQEELKGSNLSLEREVLTAKESATAENKMRKATALRSANIVYSSSVRKFDAFMKLSALMFVFISVLPVYFAFLNVWYAIISALISLFTIRFSYDAIRKYFMEHALSNAKKHLSTIGAGEFNVELKIDSGTQKLEWRK